MVVTPGRADEKRLSLFVRQGRTQNLWPSFAGHAGIFVQDQEIQAIAAKTV